MLRILNEWEQQARRLNILLIYLNTISLRKHGNKWLPSTKYTLADLFSSQYTLLLLHTSSVPATPVVAAEPSYVACLPDSSCGGHSGSTPNYIHYWVSPRPRPENLLFLVVQNSFASSVNTIKCPCCCLPRYFRVSRNDKSQLLNGVGGFFFCH